MSRVRPFRMLSVVARWSVGVALVTWRYLWETTPLHRVESQGDEADYPPPLPQDSVDDRLLLLPDGYGQLFHRVFRVRIAAADLDAAEVIHRVVRDLKRFVPTEVVDVDAGEVGAHGLTVGDELLIEMPGPWNGPVKVVYRDASVLRLATLRGHLEVGQVQFHARPEGQLLVFEIELWARAVDRLVYLLRPPGPGEGGPAQHVGPVLPRRGPGLGRSSGGRRAHRHPLGRADRRHWCYAASFPGSGWCYLRGSLGT